MGQYKVTNVTDVYWASNEGFKAGRDPLGIQNSSISTYGVILPGLTNLTGHIRYYSLYCWLLNEYDELDKHNKTEGIHQYNFLRRAELIMAFIMKDQNVRSVVGANYVNYQKYELTEDGYYDIESGADYGTENKYWSYKSGAFGQYYLGSLIFYDLVKIENNRFYLLEKGKEIAQAFKDSVTDKVRSLFLECIVGGALTNEEIVVLKPIGLNKIETGSAEWKKLNELLTKEDSNGSSLRRDTILHMLQDLGSNGITVNDFVEYRFKHYTGNEDESSFAWYFYYLCEALHYSIETIFCMILQQIDDNHNPYYNVLIDTILEDVLTNLKDEKQYDSIEEWKKNCNEDVDIMLEEVKTNIKNKDYICASAKAFALLLRLHNVFMANKESFLAFETKYGLVYQNGILSSCIHRYVGKHTHLSIEKYIATIVRQIMNEHTIVAIGKMGGGNADLRKFIFEEGRIALVEIRYPNQTNPRIESLYNFLIDMNYIENGTITTLAKEFISNYGK